MIPCTVVPTCEALGVMVTLIVPVAPGPSTSGLNVLVPKVTSDQRAPWSDVSVASQGFTSRATLVPTGVVGAPAGAHRSPRCARGPVGTDQRREQLPRAPRHFGLGDGSDHRIRSDRARREIRCAGDADQVTRVAGRIHGDRRSRL